MAYTTGKLQFPKTQNHFLNNRKTNIFSRMTFNFILAAEYRVLLEMFWYLLLQKFTDLRKLKLVTKSHQMTLLCMMSFRTTLTNIFSTAGESPAVLYSSSLSCAGVTEVAARLRQIASQYQFSLE